MQGTKMGRDFDRIYRIEQVSSQQVSNQQVSSQQSASQQVSESSNSKEFDEYFSQELGKAILVSDAFFPFADNVELAAEAGIKQIIQPGGSIRDKSVIKKCNELGIAMVFTGIRHFKH